MDQADAIVAWIDSNGKTNFTDRHIIGKSVLIDTVQNWFLMASQKSKNLTTIQFKRLITTCDETQDMVIPNGSVRVILSWSDSLPPAGGDISYHGPNNRYTLSLLLLNTLNQPLVITAADKIEAYDFTVNVNIKYLIFMHEHLIKNFKATLPAVETYYHCQLFKLPTFLVNNTRHLIRVNYMNFLKYEFF